MKIFSGTKTNYPRVKIICGQAESERKRGKRVLTHVDLVKCIHQWKEFEEFVSTLLVVVVGVVLVVVLKSVKLYHHQIH